MKTRLIDKDWGGALAELAEAALAEGAQSLRIICPFIKTGGLKYLRIQGFENIRVITRFNEHDFYNGVSDIAALRQLLDGGAEIRGVKELHSKVYLFNETHAVITSANLTQSAMTSNHECGVASTDGQIITECCEYFNDLWKKAGDNLAPEDLENSYKAVNRAKTETGEPRKPANLKDKGSKAKEVLAPFVQTSAQARNSNFDSTPQSFVKFIGSAGHRFPPSYVPFEGMQDSWCHWALGYSRRPRIVEDGAVIFIAWMVQPVGIRVFGRAVGVKHVPGRDEWTEEEMTLRDDPDYRWPYYIRVKQVEFLKGAIENGVSLYEMMREIKERSFATTLERSASGEKNVNLTSAYGRRPHVRLAPDGYDWMSNRLQAAFEKHGKLTEADLRRDYDLDWPVKGTGN